jgi:gliding motility-associated-like protein
MKFFIYRFSIFFCFIFLSLEGHGQIADFTASAISGCNPLVVSFTDKSTGTSSSTIYSWDFGDFKFSSIPSPGTTYIAAGTYTVRLTVKNGSTGTPSTKTATITVYPSPTALYTTVPTTGCPCTDVVFTNTSNANAPGAFTSLWSFGDGYTATTNNTSHVYCTPGTYNVALKVTNSAGCNGSRIDTAKVVIFEKPEGSFTASKVNLCKIPDSTIFYGNASKGKAPYSFYWEFGDGIGTSTSSTPTYKYTVAGTYTVKMVVTDKNGCMDTVTKVNFINAVPMNSNFKVPASLCASDNLAIFENTSTPTPIGTKWRWSDGGGTTGITASRPYFKGGTYTITMIDSFGPGCLDTAVKNYTVYPKPKPNFSYSPIYPCPAPANITFTNKSSASDSFLWVFGDGTTSKSISPIHTYTKDSVFTVYLIAKTSFGCLDTFRVRDTTKDFPGGYPKKRGAFFRPTYDSTNSPIIIRVHRGTLNFTSDSNSGCLPFVLKPKVSLDGGSGLPAAIYDDSSKTYFACPKFVPSGYPYGPYWPCGFDGHSTDKYADDFADPYVISSKTGTHPYPIVKYKWDFGDGSPTTTVDSPTHTYSIEGIYWVKVTVETHNGCTYTDSMMVSAGNKPTANFSLAPSQICIHDTVTFTNASSRGLSYTWLFGEGGVFSTTDSAKVYKYRYDHADTFMVKLIANRFGCIDSIRKRVVVNPPEVRPEIKYFCDSPLKVQFIDSSKKSTSVFWRFGDGFTSTSPNVIHRYASEGTYIVSQIVHNNIFNCWDSTTFEVKVFLPKPFFSTPDTTICLGETITYYDSSRTYFTNWIWNSDIFNQKDTAFTFKVKYLDTGTYSVRYIGIDIHGCKDTFLRKNYVIVSKPQMKIKASPILACAPSTIDFIDSSTNTKGATNVSRTWFWGDLSSTTSSAITASKIYTTPGNYIVKVVTSDNNGCKDSVTIKVESRRPKADFVAVLDTFTCIGRENSFFQKSSGVDLSYFWDFGDGSTSTLADPKYTYSTIGSFNVKLVVTDASGCKDSLTKMAYVKTTKPSASFNLKDSIALCPPLFATMINTSLNGVIYQWDFGNASTSTAPNPTTPYLDSGVYTIRLVAFNKYGCTDTAFRKARVMGYDGAFKYTPTEGCAPHTVNFEAELINVDVMVWDFADGYTESAVGNLKTTHTYTKPGTYLPRLILGDGKGCSTFSKGLDTIKVDDVVPVITNTPACIGTQITFNDSSYSYFSDYSSSEWTFEDGSKSTEKNPKRTYSSIGTFKVKLKTTNEKGCIDSTTKEIIVNPLPKIVAKDTVICLGDIASLSASGGISYKWLFDPSLSCTDCTNPITNSKVPIKYLVIGTDINGCENLDTLDLGIKTKTTLILASNAEVCEKQPTQLLASGAQNYFWSPEKYLSSPRIANPIAIMDSSLTYRVIGTEGSCIPDTAFIIVTIHPLPDVEAGPDQRVLAGTAVQLKGSGTNIKDYLWSPTNGLSCSDCPNPSFSATKTTVYTLIAKSEYGCSDSDKVQIIVFCDQSQLFIPNTFTPNGDGQNDYFFPQGTGIGKIKSFIIYNRWGQKVFERTNVDVNAQNQGWDGTLNGDLLSPDTFVYTMEATCDNGEIVFFKGDVTLIR